MKYNIWLSLLFVILVSSCQKADDGGDEDTTESFLVTPTGNLGSPTDITFDSNYIYITGSTYTAKGTTVSFGNTQLPAGGGSDAYLAKYDKKGNAVWAKLLGGANTESGYATAVDADGNVYTAGMFMGTSDLGGITLTAKTLTDPLGNPNFYDMFFAKYDKDGKQLWIKQLSGMGSERPAGITVDKAGKVYLLGSMGYSLTIDNRTTSANGYGFFIANFNADGSLVWSKIYAEATEVITPVAMKMASNNNLVVYGKYEGQRRIENYQLPVGRDIFTAAFSETGTPIWADTFGGSIVQDSPEGLALDNLDNVYIAGAFKGNATIAGVALTGDNWGNGFLASFDKAGKARWVKKLNDDSRQIFESLLGVSMYNNKVYITGYYNGQLPLGTVTLQSTGNYMQGFTASYNNDGTLVKAENTGTMVGIVNKFLIDNAGFGILYGNFSNPFTLDGKTYAPQGNNTVFLARYKTSL